MNDQMNSSGCRCPHHSMIPLAVVAFGAVFLLGALNILTATAVSWLWPVIVILAGLTKLTGKRCSCCGTHKNV